ncbi:MAG: LBF_2804 family protein [Myxococcota bacterium]
MKPAPGSLHDNLPLLERWGLAVLRGAPREPPVASADDPIHVLNPDELRALKRIERDAVVRAALAGSLSGAVSALAAVWAHQFLGPDGAPTSVGNALRFWGTVGVATLFASIFEIGFLYWDALRSVHRMAGAAGLALTSETVSREQREVALALARAALELPNPPHPDLALDPRRESVRWLAALAALLYKAKIALTNVALKALLRAFIGRSITLVALELVVVPVTAIWNAVVCWSVVREARLRAMGPSAALELVRLALADLAPTEAGREAALRAVASAVVRTRDLHPNHLAVIRALGAHFEPHTIAELDDSKRFLHRLAELDASDQRLALRLLVIAAILDGRLTRAEKLLLRQAFSACGRRVDLRRVEHLRRALAAGQEFEFAEVRALTDASEPA